MELRWAGILLIGLSAVFMVILVVGWIIATRSPRSGRLRSQSRWQGARSADPGFDAIRPIRLLSDSEAAFYWTLRKAVGDRWVIAVKIPLARIMKRSRYLPSGLHHMLENGHVDFLLLHPRSWEPVAAIELDDTTHLSPIRRERDQRKDELFRLARVPLLRWRVGDSWNVEEIAQAVWRAVASGGRESPPEMR